MYIYIYRERELEGERERVVNHIYLVCIGIIYMYFSPFAVASTYTFTLYSQPSYSRFTG